jgi:hypothetical protein
VSVPAMGGGVASPAYVKGSETKDCCTRRCCDEIVADGPFNLLSIRRLVVYDHGYAFGEWSLMKLVELTGPS